MMKIRIGKAKDNDYVIEDPHVSRYHALLSKDEQGALYIDDIGSTNGTFVNDSQVIRKKITAYDKVRLGDHYFLNTLEVLKVDNDYSVEFVALKQVYDDYVKEKIKIQSSNQFKTRLFQSFPFALIGMVGIIFGFLGKGSHTLFLISLFITVCAPTIGIYMGARQAAKIPGKLQELANQFKINYVCPKCGTFLGEIPWESLKNKKHCTVSSCKAKWVNP